MNKKILNIQQLKKKISSLKKNNKKIIQCHGVFDLIHIGHIKHFNFAKSKGDFLVISLTSDSFVNKGPGRPVFTHLYRAEFLSNIECIDAIYINHSASAVSAINIIRPDVFIKGSDYKILKKDKTKKIIKEVEAVHKNKGKIMFSNEITSSSSGLINEFSDLFNNEQKFFLNSIKKKYSIDYIQDQFEKLKKLKVFLIGEVIVDEYVFGDVLGKSGKEPHLVMQKKIQRKYLGGAGAIANHLSDFCKSVNLLTLIGEKKESLNFINLSLRKNINIKYLLKKNSPTITKTRYIDQVSKNKLLGVYVIDDSLISKSDEKKIIKYSKEIVDKVDIIIVADYGHGLITPNLAKYFNTLKKFKSLNAQVNASNIGYQSLNKYINIPLLIINENELRHELRDKKTRIELLSINLIKKFKIKNLVVTRGSSGSFMVDEKLRFNYCPAFASKVVDKVGSGDALFTIISLCKKINLNNDLSLFFGSIAAASSVENIGNSFFTEKKSFLRQIEYSLK